MKPEGFYAIGDEQNMTVIIREQHEKEVTDTYRHLYDPADLSGTISIVCDDDRLLTPGVRRFGGVGNIPYSLAVAQEHSEAGSFDSPMKAYAVSLVPTLREADIVSIAHSDESTEKGSTIDMSIETGSIGCLWLDKLAVLSALTVEEQEEVFKRSSLIRPESFADREGVELFGGIIDATKRLVERPVVFGGYNGRELAIGVIKSGALPVVAEGAHDPNSKAFYNMIPGTLFNAAKAKEEGLPAYSQTGWSTDIIMNKLRLFPFDNAKMQMIDLVNFAATTIALGLDQKDVMAMRPAA
jgi:hypothetical protein